MSIMICFLIFVSVVIIVFGLLIWQIITDYLADKEWEHKRKKMWLYEKFHKRLWDIEYDTQTSGIVLINSSQTWLLHEAELDMKKAGPYDLIITDTVSVPILIYKSKKRWEVVKILCCGRTK